MWERNESYLEQKPLVHHLPPQRGSPEEDTCVPGRVQHLQSGRLTGSAERERSEKSRLPAPTR